MTSFNSHSSPAVGEFTFVRHDKEQFMVTWKDSKVTHGIMVRYGALHPLESLLVRAGFEQTEEIPDVENDECQCKACNRVMDIEDSIKFQGELVCTFCGEDLLKQHNKELVANETDSVCERDW